MILIKVKRHQLVIVVDLEKGRYWVNDDSPKGYILERMLVGMRPAGLIRHQVSRPGIRYVDWLIPGVWA
jgi:ABC-2 type transport system permease protein